MKAPPAQLPPPAIAASNPLAPRRQQRSPARAQPSAAAPTEAVAPASATAKAMHRIDPACLAVLPRGPGVYIFKGDGRLPLYIGKSVDIRSRVLAHLRAEDEAAMLAQARRVDFVETAGELGALLLEARLIKAQSPLFNIRLRRLRQLCVMALVPNAPGLQVQIVSGRDVALGLADGLYGLFSSVHAAQAKLRELADLHGLCLGLLGLEKTGTRGCFGLQVKTCAGACVGREDRHLHDQRLLAALTDLQVHAWPHAGAVELVEQRGDWVQRHRIQDWRHLSTWCSRAQQFDTFEQPGFDLDTYKILAKPIMLGESAKPADSPKPPAA